MEKQIYPIGEQNFKSIREEGKIYVDKTQYIPLLMEQKCLFLSRPRRFGKSLFLSTLENFFLGRRDLFKGLFIYDYKWDWIEYPVIRIDLNGSNYHEDDGLKNKLSYIIGFHENKFGIPAKENLNISERFLSLISTVSQNCGRQVVVLVDEYEKPLLDVIGDEKKLKEYRNILSGFYSVLKSAEEYIKLIFLTGVSRFGHLNIFSGLNNLIDISLEDEFASICGITDKELRECFVSGITRLAQNQDCDYNQAIDKLKYHYDGYHFSGSLVDVYNPFSLFSCLRTSKFSEKWFQTGSSSFLLNITRRNRFDLTKLENLRVDENTLLGLDSEFNDPVTLLYQTGYLTIKHYDKISEVYTLGLPNFEVKNALYSAIIPHYLGANFKNDRVQSLEFIDLLENGEIKTAMQRLKEYFSSIPYDVKLDYESEFQQVIYSYFAHLGLLSKTELEKKTSDGRIDMILKLKDYIYIFEFKLGTDAAKALNQINSKDYGLQWQGGKRKVIKVGVAFSPKTRGIADFKIDFA